MSVHSNRRRDVGQTLCASAYGSVSLRSYAHRCALGWPAVSESSTVAWIRSGKSWIQQEKPMYLCAAMTVTAPLLCLSTFQVCLSKTKPQLSAPSLQAIGASAHFVLRWAQGSPTQGSLLSCPFLYKKKWGELPGPQTPLDVLYLKWRVLLWSLAATGTGAGGTGRGPARRLHCLPSHWIPAFPTSTTPSTL